MAAVLRIDNIEQNYPGVKALKGVTLELHSGEILGLVGENGAGKSTLIRILGGLEEPTAGTVYRDGERVAFKGSAESQAAGISVVSQEFRLVPQLSVAENIFLGNELTRGGVIDRNETLRRSEEVLATLGVDLDPLRPVSELTIGDRQMAEIARALSRDFDVLILDEPTAALNGAEITALHEIVRRLASQGKTVIYVSHHLDEIFALCSTVAVLRDGALVAQGNAADISEAELVEHMLGRPPQHYERGETQEATEIMLDVKELHTGASSTPVSFQVRKGEILGLAGLIGSGRTELTRAIFGDSGPVVGQIHVEGQEVSIRNIRDAVHAGIFMLSEDRKREGILAHLDVTENSMLSRDRKSLPLLRRLMPVPKEEGQVFSKLREDLRIKVPHGRQLIGNLSGGNQQKVLFGRALLSGCRVLLLNEPTRGVDVGAKADIYRLIRELADSGVSVLVSSSDAPELAAISDRCLVFFAGKVVAELSAQAITEDNIVRASIGQIDSASGLRDDSLEPAELAHDGSQDQ